MTRCKVKEDHEGLHVIAGDRIYRPGAVAPHALRRRMDDAGLTVGTSVRVAPDKDEPLAAVTPPDGRVVFWHVDGPTRRQGLTTAPQDAVWKDDGKRDFRRVVIG